MAEPSEYSENLSLQVSFHAFAIGQGMRENGCTTNWRALPASLLEIPEGGDWELRLEKQKSPLIIKDGEALLIPAGLRHLLKCRTKKTMKTRFLLGSFLWLSQVDIISKAGIPLHLKASESRGLKIQLDKMCKLWNTRKHSVADSVLLNELAFKTLGILLKSGQKNFSVEDLKPGRLSEILAIMHEKPESIQTCAYLASKAGLSSSRFNAVFRESMGVAPKVYLGNLRIKKASALLISSSMTIAEISDKCGFSSSSYFCRFFTSHTGMSPGAFREAFSKTQFS